MRACSMTSGESCSIGETVAIKLHDTGWRDAASAAWFKINLAYKKSQNATIKYVVSDEKVEY